MARYHVTPATRDHVVTLAQRLHPRSTAEAVDLRHPGEASLLKGLSDSAEVWTGFADDVPVCMFGIVPDSDISNSGHIWLALSEDIARHTRAFLRLNRAYLASRPYHILYGFVFARNTVSIRWLKWLGFRVSDELITDADTGHDFRYFAMERT